MVILIRPSAVEALYRGDEFERRSFHVGTHYFINRATYEPWTETRDRFAHATNAYLGAAGSLSGDDLYLFHHLKIRQALNESIELHLDYLHDRDFDGHYERFPMGLRYHWLPHWSLELVGEPAPDKEYADIGAAMAYANALTAFRMQVLYPDFVFNAKNPDDASFKRRVPNLQFSLRHAASKTCTIFARADIDPPRTLLNPTQSFAFDFEKYQGEAGMRWMLSKESHIEAIVEGEYTRKLRLGLEPEDANDFSEDRDYAQASIEYLRRLHDDTFVRAGLIYVLFDENQNYPFAPDKSLLTDRHDRILYAGRVWPLRGGLNVNTLALLNRLDERQTRQNPEELARYHKWLVRLSASLVFSGEHYMLEAGAAANVDQTRFGGGFVKVFADF